LVAALNELFPIVHNQGAPARAPFEATARMLLDVLRQAAALDLSVYPEVDEPAQREETGAS
jgi:hypothetical protein